MSADIVFNGGDEIRQPFQVRVGEDIANLTGFVIRAVVYNPFVGELELTPANGRLIIISLTPEEGQPHGVFIIDELESKGMPLGLAKAYVRIVITDPAGITMSTEPTFFARMI